MQRAGVGGELLEHLRHRSSRRMLVGTWAAADWAVRFYRRHGFELVSTRQKEHASRALLDDPQAPGADVCRAREPPAGPRLRRRRRRHRGAPRRCWCTICAANDQG